jgi:hypothetical protein
MNDKLIKAAEEAINKWPLMIDKSREVLFMEGVEFGAQWQEQQDGWVSVDDVHELILKERIRAIETVAGYMLKYDKLHKENLAAGQPMAFVLSGMSESARNIMNALSGKTALNMDTPLIDVIKKDYPLPKAPAK